MVQNGRMPLAEAQSVSRLTGTREGADLTILIVRPNTRLGNTLLMTPLIGEIGAALPNAKVDVLSACPAAAEVFQALPVRQVHQLPFRGVRHPLRYLKILAQVRRRRYDLILDPSPNSWTGRFLTRWLNGRTRIGFVHARRHQGVEISIPFEGAPRHMGAYPVYLLRRALLGMETSAAARDDAKLEIRLSESERAAGREQLQQRLGTGRSGPVLAVATHATGAKRFPLEWWRSMIRQVQVLRPTVQVIEIRPPSGAASLPEFAGYASRRTREVAAVIEAAGCFVCADSGLMHLGAATDATTVGLFKVTLPELYEPRRGGSCALTARDDAPGEVAERVARLLS